MDKKIVRRPPSTTLDNSLANVPDLLKRIYVNRGISSASQIEYTLKNLLHPDSMLGLEMAVSILVDAIQNQLKVCIIGDFDADGATSTVLAVRALTRFGAKNVCYLVPNRFEYGYGLTPEIVELASQNKPDIIVTVDNGISSVQGVERANELNIQVVVTDHHLPGKEIPNAAAIVNPNQQGCDFPSKNLAGVGVIFYVMSALRTRLKSEGWFEENSLSVPNMADFLDLVVLGTVADVVPLDYNNRLLVAQGLKRMKAGYCVPGIKALLDVANKSLSQVSSTDIGFAIGPRLNAAGRLDDMSLGIQCLLSDSEYEARTLAQELDDLNKERKAIEASMKAEAKVFIDELHLTHLPEGICFYREDWHQGVIGILASRIKDKLHRPTIVFAQGESGQLKGSGRSIPGVHIRDILDEIAALSPSVISKFGGHAMAAGLTIEESAFNEFQQLFSHVIAKHVDNETLEAKLYSDGVLTHAELNLESAELLENAGPWGQKFPEPEFDGQFKVIALRWLQDKHLKLTLRPSEFSGISVDAIAFNLEKAKYPLKVDDNITIFYRLNINEYKGVRSLQLLVNSLEYHN